MCLVNITLTAKSALHISQFARYMAPAIYYTAVGLEKMWRTDREQGTDREFNYIGHSYPLWIVGGSGPTSGRLQGRAVQNLRLCYRRLE